ncbi:MAG: hypothetical protein J7J25_03575 [Candidatus Omnitrophica bacterium]|nr:hypothetical protein [Candidatus Omnitrophota bacterium]
MYKRIYLVLIGGIFFCFYTASLAAEEIVGKYFTLVCFSGCDRSEFAYKINANYLLQRDIEYSPATPDSIIAKSLDALYLDVSDILDIHIYSYHGKIVVYPTRQALKEDVFRNFEGQKPDLPSLYIHSTDTIFISLADMTMPMLAHEMAHAIMSHYFVVPPPAKIQEVLAGYVEYSIRKSTGTLPH